VTWIDGDGLGAMPDALLRRVGVARPCDVGLVWLDVTSATASWAGIDHNSDEIGKAAVDLVVCKIWAGERVLPRVHRSALVHCCWREGETVRR